MFEVKIDGQWQTGQWWTTEEFLRRLPRRRSGRKRIPGRELANWIDTLVAHKAGWPEPLEDLVRREIGQVIDGRTAQRWELNARRRGLYSRESRKLTELGLATATRHRVVTNPIGSGPSGLPRDELGIGLVEHGTVVKIEKADARPRVRGGAPRRPIRPKQKQRKRKTTGR